MSNISTWLQALETPLLLLGFLFLIGSLDDFFIDIVYAANRLRPLQIPHFEWMRWLNFPERKIAVLIPAWREHSVLEAMVRTNLTRINYASYRFIVGVYPNDPETLTIAKDLERRYPHLVSVVITDRPGPTSKAHCLNCMLRVLSQTTSMALKAGEGWVPDIVAIHDAEDVIHPLAFKAVNAQRDFDFLQVPIFSLPVSAKSWVAGTYMDEFAEIHLKEMPARVKLQMPVPSAGVGTFFAWEFFEKLGNRFGYWFDEKNLTEDYEISLRVARLGGRQKFLLVKDPEDQIIATQEYFPDSLGRSIRQKTRWTTGISLQTWKTWSWFGGSGSFWKDLGVSYALWRDRKALWSNPASITGWILAAITLVLVWMNPEGMIPLRHEHLLKALFVANTFLFSLRIIQRARFASELYGWPQGILSSPRLVISTVINTSASLRAMNQFAQRQATKTNTGTIEWDKTDHHFPDLLPPESNNRKEQNLS
jgi:bacteriophage N4 adsorption protein B